MAYQKGEDVEINIPEQMNITSVFADENVKGDRADKVAIRFAGEQTVYTPQDLTYREIGELINKTGNALKSLGLQLEDRVLMIVLDSPEFVTTFLGAIKIGAIPIPVNTMLSPGQYKYILNDSRAKALVVHEELASSIEEMRRELRFLEHFIVIGEAKKGQISYYDIVDSASTQLEAVVLSKDDFAFWLYSSGTTGAPKGVVHLQHDMLYCADTFFKHVVGINERDVVLSASKLFFAYGLGNAMYSPFRAGATAVLYPGRPEPEKLFELIEEYRVTVFYAVPMVYNRMLTVAGVEGKYDVSSLRLCMTGAEALPPAMYSRWKERFGVELLDTIGSTEILHSFISNRPGSNKPGTTGVAVPGYELRTVDNEGKDIPVGQAGRLLVKGDSIGAFYWNKHELSKKTFLGEWIDTGDLYIEDEEGFWSHAGRADDMMRSRGLWVSPVEVENAVAGHHAILEVAVVQGFSEEGIGTIKAFVVLKDGYGSAPQLQDELKVFLRSNGLAGYKIPEKFEFVAELPKTTTGKIQRFKLREQERQRMLA